MYSYCSCEIVAERDKLASPAKGPRCGGTNLCGVVSYDLAKISKKLHKTETILDCRNGGWGGAGGEARASPPPL